MAPLPGFLKQKRVPGYVWELLAGISASAFFFSMLALFLPVPFIAEDRPGFLLGIAAGAAAALAGAVHMWKSLSSSLMLGEGAAVKRLILHNTIRYLFFAAVILWVAVTRYVNPVGVFLGIFGLKFGAYLQPLFHKLAGMLAFPRGGHG